MSDTTAATDNVGFPAVPLLANSYNLADLEAAAVHAQGLKTDDGREAAFGRIATDKALLQDVVEGFANPPLPEGTQLGEVEDAQGRVVTAPVAIPEGEEPETETPSTGKRRGNKASDVKTDGSGDTGTTNTAGQGDS